MMPIALVGVSLKPVSAIAAGGEQFRGADRGEIRDHRVRRRCAVGCPMLRTAIEFGLANEDAGVSAGTVTVTPCDSRGTWLVTLHGDHDLATRTNLELQTAGIWRFCKVVVIDLSDATFIDSGVIRWLLRVERELEGANASTLSIVQGPPGCAAAHIFGLLRMSHVMACYETRVEALDQAALSSGQVTHRTRAEGVQLVRHAS
jgi:hypothetical protein